ncbi:MAG: WD40 repeat domain-containing protein [Janthinobacterium lividum]
MIQALLDDYIETLHFSPDGTTLICAQTNRDISVWGTAEGLEQSYAFSTGLKRLYGTALSSDGTHLAAAGEGPLRAWKLALEGQENVLELEQGFSDDYLASAVFSPDGTRLLAAGNSEELHVVNLGSTSIEQDNGPGTDEDAEEGFWLRERTSSLVFHPNKQTLMATSSSQGGSAVLFCDLHFDQKGYFLTERNDLTVKLPADVLSPAAFSPDGRFFAFADWDMHLYQFPSRQRVVSFDIQGKQRMGALPDRGSANVNAFWSNALFTPDGRTLIGGSPGGQIFLWDVPTGALRQTLTGHTDGILALAMNSSGTRLASSGRDKTLRLWQIDAVGR